MSVVKLQRCELEASTDRKLWPVGVRAVASLRKVGRLPEKLGENAIGKSREQIYTEVAEGMLAARQNVLETFTARSNSN